MGITKSDFEFWKEEIKKGESFDWDIPGGYVVIGKVGLTVCKLRKTTWYTKHVNFWQDKTYKEVMEELKNQEWKVDNE